MIASFANQGIVIIGAVVVVVELLDNGGNARCLQTE